MTRPRLIYCTSFFVNLLVQSSNTRQSLGQSILLETLSVTLTVSTFEVCRYLSKNSGFLSSRLWTSPKHSNRESNASVNMQIQVLSLVLCALGMIHFVGGTRDPSVPGKLTIAGLYDALTRFIVLNLEQTACRSVGTIRSL